MPSTIKSSVASAGCLAYEYELGTSPFPPCLKHPFVVKARLRSMKDAIASQLSIMIMGDLMSISWFVMRSNSDSGSSSLASSKLGIITCSRVMVAPLGLEPPTNSFTHG